MSTPLPGEPAAAGRRPAPDAEAQARQIIDAVNEAMVHAPTRYRDDSPLPLIGDTPPVVQPGRPPMSSRAADASGMMLAGGFLALCLGGATSAVMYASGYADPVVIGIIGATPAALALAVGRLMRSARGVLPDEHHHHYNGPVTQDHSNITINNRWWGKSTNKR